MKILVINCGSSSLKYQLMDMSDESVLCKGAIERIGLPISGGEENVIIKVNGEKYTYDKELPTHVDAFNEVKYIISEGEHKVVDSFDEIDAIGHRVVQGGSIFHKSVLVDEQAAAGVKKLGPLAPLHNPANLQGYEACLAVVGPDVPQVFIQQCRQRLICMLFLMSITKNMPFVVTASTAHLTSSFLKELRTEWAKILKI